MQKILETFAFAMLIGGQFLAALVTLSKRAVLYPDADKQQGHRDPARMPRESDPRQSIGRERKPERGVRREASV